jgi:hypothetical protein
MNKQPQSAKLCDSFARNSGQKPDGNQEPGHSSPHYSHGTCNLSMAIGEDDLGHLHGTKKTKLMRKIQAGKMVD